MARIRQIYWIPWKETGCNKSWARLDFSQKSQPLDILLNDGVISPHNGHFLSADMNLAAFSFIYHLFCRKSHFTHDSKKKVKRMMCKHLIEGCIKVSDTEVSRTKHNTEPILSLYPAWLSLLSSNDAWLVRYKKKNIPKKGRKRKTENKINPMTSHTSVGGLPPVFTFPQVIPFSSEWVCVDSLYGQHWWCFAADERVCSAL